jgi:hypothetical protein
MTNDDRINGDAEQGTERPQWGRFEALGPGAAGEKAGGFRAQTDR